MGNCPACGAEVTADDFYCNHCGKHLKVCPSCRFELNRETAIHAKYCPNCGSLLERFSLGLGATIALWLLSLILSAAVSAIFYQNLLLATVLAESALAVPPFLYLLRRRSLIQSLFRRPSIKEFLLGVMISPVSFTINAVINYPLTLAFPPPRDYLDAMESLAPRSILDLIIWFIIILIVVGPCEEFLSRWLMQKGLETRFNPKAGLVLASVLFGLSHLSPWSSVGVTAAGLVIGYVYQRRNYNLWAPMGVHVGHDWLAFTLLYISLHPV